MTEQPPELPLQRGRHRRCHNVRACSRIKRQGLNRGIVHLGQGGHGQLRIANNSHKENRCHQQRRRNWSQNKRARRTQGAALPAEFPDAAFTATTTFELSCNLSKLLLARTSPGLIPVTCVLPASVTPALMLRMCAVLSCST